jgi:hypothetical protein
MQNAQSPHRALQPLHRAHTLKTPTEDEPMTEQKQDPLTWITQALNDAAQTLPPAARAAFIAKANSDLTDLARALQEPAQAFVPQRQPLAPVDEG